MHLRAPLVHLEPEELGLQIKPDLLERLPKSFGADATCKEDQLERLQTPTTIRVGLPGDEKALNQCCHDETTKQSIRQKGDTASRDLNQRANAVRSTKCFRAHNIKMEKGHERGDQTPCVERAAASRDCICFLNGENARLMNPASEQEDDQTLYGARFLN